MAKRTPATPHALYPPDDSENYRYPPREDEPPKATARVRVRWAPSARRTEWEDEE